MIGKLICASMLVASGPVFGQDATRSPLSKGKADLAEIHRCIVVPGAGWTAGGEAAGRSIDLEFRASAAADGGGVPTISGRAINQVGVSVKSSKRVASSSASSATVACSQASSSDASSSDAGQKSADMFLHIRGDAAAAGWSCSVTGSEDAAQFVLTLKLPPTPSAGAGRSEWSFGASNSGSHRVSIVPSGSKVAGASLIACSSKDGKLGYDLAVNKK